MNITYTVASLPTLAFGSDPGLSREEFVEKCGGEEYLANLIDKCGWQKLETQLRNAMAEARGGEKYKRATDGCSLFWKNRVLACFQEKDMLRRDEMLDRVWWDAAGELTPVADPIGEKALATYAIRLNIAIKRAGISKDNGNEAFNRLTAETKR